MADSVGARLSRTLGGSLPGPVMYRYVGGTVCTVLGLFLLVRR